MYLLVFLSIYQSVYLYLIKYVRRCMVLNKVKSISMKIESYSSRNSNIVMIIIQWKILTF